MTTALIPVGGRLDLRTYADVAAAALLMVATLPGRTHGLGLITEPLLAELQLDRVEYATLNLWATIIGAAFCLPSGWILDRLGPRAVGAIVAFLLGVVVVATSFIDAALAAVTLFALITLTRGLGQSGLSVTSLALMGKSGAGRSGFASALYAAGVALGFAGATALVKYAGDHLCLGWHALWAGMGWVLILGIPPVVWLLASPGCAWKRESVDDFHPSAEGEPLEQLHGATLWEALRGPTFWVVATTTSAYGLVGSGLSLFQQSVLEERGFDRDVFLTSATLSPLAGLLGNLIGGALLRCVGVTRVLVVGATGVAIGLALFQSIVTPPRFTCTREGWEPPVGSSRWRSWAGGGIFTAWPIWGKSKAPPKLLPCWLRPSARSCSPDRTERSAVLPRCYKGWRSRSGCWRCPRGLSGSSTMIHRLRRLADEPLHVYG